MTSQFDDASCSEAYMYQEYYKSSLEDIFHAQDVGVCINDDCKRMYSSVSCVNTVTDSDTARCRLLSQRPVLVIFVGNLASFSSTAHLHETLSAAQDRLRVLNESEHPYSRVHLSSCVISGCSSDVDLASLIDHHQSQPWHESSKIRQYLNAFMKTLAEQIMQYTHDLLVGIAHTGCAFSTQLKHGMQLSSSIQWGVSLDREEYSRDMMQLSQAHDVYISRQRFFTNVRPPLRSMNAQVCGALADLGFPVPAGYMGEKGEPYTFETNPPRQLQFIADTLMLVGSTNLSAILLGKAIALLKDRGVDAWGLTRAATMQYRVALLKDLQNGMVPPSLGKDFALRLRVQENVVKQAKELLALQQQNCGVEFRDCVVLKQFTVTAREQSTGAWGAALLPKRSEGAPFESRNVWLRRILNCLENKCTLTDELCVHVYTSILQHDTLEKPLSTELNALLLEVYDDCAHKSPLREVQMWAVGEGEVQSSNVAKAMQEALNVACKQKQGGMLLALLPHVLLVEPKQQTKNVWTEVLALVGSQVLAQKVLVKLLPKLRHELRPRELTDLVTASIQGPLVATESPLQPALQALETQETLKVHCLLMQCALPPQRHLPLLMPQSVYVEAGRQTAMPVRAITGSITPTSTYGRLVLKVFPLLAVLALNACGTDLPAAELEPVYAFLSQEYSGNDVFKSERWFFCNDIHIVSNDMGSAPACYTDTTEYQELMARLTFMDCNLDMAQQNEVLDDDASEDSDVFVPEGLSPTNYGDIDACVLPNSTCRLVKNSGSNAFTLKYEVETPKQLVTKITQSRPAITPEAFCTLLGALGHEEQLNVCLRNSLLARKMTASLISSALLSRILEVPVARGVTQSEVLQTNNTACDLQVHVNGLTAVVLLSNAEFVPIDKLQPTSYSVSIPLATTVAVILPAHTTVPVALSFDTGLQPNNCFCYIAHVLCMAGRCAVELPIETHSQCRNTQFASVDKLFQYSKKPLTDCLTLLPCVSELLPYRGTMLACNITTTLQPPPKQPESTIILAEVLDLATGDMHAQSQEEILTQTSSLLESGVAPSIGTVPLTHVDAPPNPLVVTRLAPIKKMCKFILPEVKPLASPLKPKKKPQSRFHTFTKGDFNRATSGGQVNSSSGNMIGSSTVLNANTMPTLSSSANHMTFHNNHLTSSQSSSNVQLLSSVSSTNLLSHSHSSSSMTNMQSLRHNPSRVMTFSPGSTPQFTSQPPLSLIISSSPK